MRSKWAPGAEVASYYRDHCRTACMEHVADDCRPSKSCTVSLETQTRTQMQQRHAQRSGSQGSDVKIASSLGCRSRSLLATHTQVVMVSRSCALGVNLGVCGPEWSRSGHTALSLTQRHTQSCFQQCRLTPHIKHPQGSNLSPDTVWRANGGGLSNTVACSMSYACPGWG